jgi:hypothetical protein
MVRQLELSTIEDWLAGHRVTRGETRFSAKVSHALPEAEERRKIADMKVDRVSARVLAQLFDGD